MDKYGMFEENKVSKNNFQANPDFMLVLISSADTEEELFANVGFMPNI